MAGEYFAPLRDYQLEISEKILAGHNDLIILPTGTGKTRIATNLIQTHLTHTDKAKVLFLAPTTVLVDQQFENIKRDLDTDMELECFKATGGVIKNLDHLEEILKEDNYRVIVATPQIAVNYLQGFRTSSIEVFTLIIFDEVHHSRAKEAPYDILMRRYIFEKLSNPAPAKLPQMVGLTATVGVGDSKSREDTVSYLLSLCSRLSLTQPPTPVRNSSNFLNLERLKALPEKDIAKVKLARVDPFSIFLKNEIIKGIVSDLKTKLDNTPELNSAAKLFSPRDPILQGFENCLDSTKHSLDLIVTDRESGVGSVIWECKVMLNHLRIYYLGLRYACLATCKAAFEYIEQEMNFDPQTAVECWRRYDSDWRTRLEDLSSNEHEYPNPKLIELQNRIDEILNLKHTSGDESSRIMVFVENRAVAGMISRWLNEQSPEYRSERFVSSNKANDTDGSCMSRAEASNIMDKFRVGHLNILVATSILAEGLDIPECNGVIRYLFITDAIAEQQIPGRVRDNRGKVVAIVDEAKLKQYISNKPKERWMNEALVTVRDMDSDLFTAQVSQCQRRLYDEERARLTRLENRANHMMNNEQDVRVQCRQCSQELGSLSDLFQYLSSHYLNLDPKVGDKMAIVTGDRSGLQQEVFDGIEELHHLRCTGTIVGTESKCSSRVGKLLKLNICGESRLVATWKIKSIKLVYQGSPHTRAVYLPKQFVDVKARFGMKIIHQEDLREISEQLPRFTL